MDEALSRVMALLREGDGTFTRQDVADILNLAAFSVVTRSDPSEEVGDRYVLSAGPLHLELTWKTSFDE